MSSKLASLARIVFSSKAAAARAAPAAIVGPLQKILGGRADDESQDEPHNDDEAVSNAQDDNGAMMLEESTKDAEEAARHNGIFSALVARGEAASRFLGSPTAVENPSVRRELEDFRKDYYRRAIAAKEAEDARANDRIVDPDLSVPVGDEYLYLAQ